ncbi:putative leucine-rich repeat protein (LRRP) [Trypanosoma grayi]|uniref:putative leucine-rich repeat protein (LRRP) n=1 Tax=Trypanosoma grayi TaxID=71804 RepID=UPI0004F41194|nr:putative leucine-rich repeat protein (LRRP) [Trypanosoma grayi]KEG12428.1 putative leucine-rich repeat protein (LRRP) [Trypanosoma grayi]
MPVARKPPPAWSAKALPPRAEGVECDAHVPMGCGKSCGGSRLSPLLQRQQGRWREPCSSLHSSPRQRSNAASPAVASTSRAKKRPLMTSTQNCSRAKCTKAPLIPSNGGELAMGQHEKLIAQRLSNTSCVSSFESLSRFVPVSNVVVGHGAASASTECHDVDEMGVNSSVVFGDVLTDDMLREWTGWEDLHLVLSAEFRVDALRTVGIDTLGERLPLLNSLRLNNSRIPQIRQLGTKFMNLKRIWLGSSHLENLRGIGACVPVLEELYAAFNSVHDITPLLDLSETLEVVDLEGNEIQDTTSLIRCLPLLKKVKYLTLQGNPVVMRQSIPSKTNNDRAGNRYLSKSFREFVRSLMPDLQYLDDTALNFRSSPNSGREQKQGGKGGAARKKNLHTHVDPLNVALCDEYMFLQKCIRECGFDALEEAVAEETRAVCSRPQTSSAGARRCGSALANSQGSQRPCSSSQRVLRSLSGSNRISSGDVRWPVNGRITPTPPASLQSPFVSSLTSGRVLVGGGAGLRRGLPPLRPSQVTTSVSSANSSSNGESSSAHHHDSSGMGTSSPAVVRIDANSPLPTGELNSPDALPLRAEPGDDIPLFDEDEDEWDLYKQNLMRRVESRDSGLQRWAKYISSGSAVSSRVGNESGGMSSCSHVASTRDTSASSGITPTPSVNKPQTPAVASSSSLLPAPPPRSATMTEGEKSNAMIDKCLSASKSHGDEVEEEDDDEDKKAWQWELVRSVARSRTQTARAASALGCLRLGEE